MEFLHYVEASIDDPEKIMSPRVKQLAKQVENIKTNQEVGVKYMRLWEEFIYERMEGREEGREEAREEAQIAKINLIRVNLEEDCEKDMLCHFLREKKENIDLVYDAMKAHPEMNDKELWEVINEKWIIE